ncbi:MAG: tyrosine-protein phosphatase [Prevotella sp.]|nr:tyrosine-protein phosphatase [Prevotella sp.]
MHNRELNIRDLGGIPFASGKGAVPHGLFIRSGKLSVLSKEQCLKLCKKYHINCVIDLRTPVEAAEFPDLLPDDVIYMQIPLLKDATVGISHETGSDPMTIIRRLRKQPEKLKEMAPDFNILYRDVVTDEYSRKQLDQVVATLKNNAEKGLCTLFHCTAGKDRTGIVSMALLKSYGVADGEIINDYMRTNRNAFWPTMKKCVGIGILTWNWSLVRTAYQSFMARKKLIQTAIKHYK